METLHIRLILFYIISYDEAELILIFSLNTVHVCNATASSEITYSMGSRGGGGVLDFLCVFFLSVLFVVL